MSRAVLFLRRADIVAKAVPSHLIPKIIIRRDGVKQKYYTAPPETRPPRDEVAVVSAGPGKIGIMFDYDASLVSRVKQVGGGSWDAKNRQWVFPASRFPQIEQVMANLALTENAMKSLEAAGYLVREGAAGAEADESKNPAALLKRAREGVKTNPLEGTDKQISWATDLRGGYLESLANLLLNDPQLDDQGRVEALRNEVIRARRIESARFWIDNRDRNPVEIKKILHDMYPDLDGSGADDTTKAAQQPVEYDEDGFPKTTYQFQTNAPAKLFPEQVTDATRVLAMWQSGAKGMLLANGTGTGKTYVYAAAIREWQAKGKKVLLIVPSKDTKEQTEAALEHMGVAKGSADIITYTDLSLGKVQPGGHNVTIFDEAHKIKGMFGAKRSKRGEAALDFIKNTQFTLFSTATPFEHPRDTKYMALAGLMPRGMKFDDWITKYGIRIERGYNDSKEYVFRGTPADLKRLHDDLKQRGYLTKRLFEPPPGMVEAASPAADIGEDWLSAMKAVGDRLEKAADRYSQYRGLIMAQRTMLLRQVLERAKVEAAIPTIRAELEAGRSVAVFTQYRSEKVVGTDDLLSESEGDSQVREIIRRALAGISLPLRSPTDRLKEVFPEAELYTGEQTQAQLRRAKTRFQSGETKLLVLTGAKGGTGLSFHDTVGNRPTSQVVITLPWSAMELDQMLGRTVRKGLASQVRILMPVSQALFERRLASIIGAKMQLMGATVRGGEAGVSQEALDAFTYGYATAKPEGLDAILQSVPEIKPEAVAAPAGVSAPEQPGAVSESAITPEQREGLESALPRDMFGNPLPEPKPPRERPRPPLPGQGTKANVPGYTAITRRYIKPDGTTYTKQVWVRADRARRERARMTARPTRSPEQLSLFDLAIRGGSPVAKAQFVLYLRQGRI